MKYVSIRMPDAGPLGDTLREASVLAIVLAFFVNRFFGGCVELVFTLATHLPFLSAIILTPDQFHRLHSSAAEAIGFELHVYSPKSRPRLSAPTFCFGVDAHKFRFFDDNVLH